MPGDTQLPRPATRAEVIQLNAHQKSEFDKAPKQKQQDALNWEQVIWAIDSIKGLRGSLTTAVDLFLARAKDGDLEPKTLNQLAAVAVGSRAMPSRTTVFEKIASYKDKGLDGLIKQHKGKVRQEGGWEGLALELYSQPSKPDISAVHRALINRYGMSCSIDQVRNYLRALPATLGAMSPARIGRDLYKQTQTKYIARCTTNLLPGDIYTADGYRADVYLAHPVTGDIWRPEIMHVLDLESRYLVGYRIMAHESSYDVMIAWAEIFERWDHVPPLLYVDNGSGYKNRLADDEIAGYYRRAGVQEIIHSLPKNPRGHGHIERFHRIVKDRFLKLWRPEFYCGPDMASDVLNKTVSDCKAKRITPPSLAEFVEAYDQWLVEYHNDKHPEDKNKTHLSSWSALQPIRPHASARQIARPSEKRIVSKASVQINNRRYVHADLHAWNNLPVLVEVDILTDKTADIRTLKGELICEATLVEKIGIVGDSFLQDQRNKAQVEATKRLQKKLDELNARAGLVIDVDSVVDNAQTLMQPATPELPNLTPSADFSLDDFLN
ncbi:MAG: Mu transposase C-terminal domain-containing protein [Methylococcaceae bacterium]|nr:Mu transposase C-terminal domain-containing protein [Methylococcaceae bacterium]MDP3020540.1 Mu transposase C-terminal domain-containing protein [Methylococcaceae bacterium]MDP3389731.1 Mu transposase C-terminal domain-containing protein [Methylococcaceae bacterium]MDP3932528.1 Mu transposase C-terminal domain-containing protein [Methylococcaceae bacterium]